MSIEHRFYIGPFVKVIEKLTTATVDHCADHDLPKDAAYCPFCGRKAAKRYAEGEVGTAPPDWYTRNGGTEPGDFYSYLCPITTADTSQAFTLNGTRYRSHLFLPNRYYSELEIQEQEGRRAPQVCSFLDSNLDSQKVIQKFKELFKPQIDYLLECFHTVNLDFGCISYCGNREEEPRLSRSN